MANEKRLIEIPSDGIIRIPIMRGNDNIGEKRIDLSHYPTVDAVEVVHGRWLKTEVEAGDPYDGNSVYCFDVMMCSVCGCHFDVSEAMNYCPNCGAKMDGDWNG